MRRTGKKYRMEAVMLLASGLLFFSCAEIPINSIDSGKHVPTEQGVPNSADIPAKCGSNPASSTPGPYVQLQVKNEVPFTQEIYQLLDSLGGQLGDNQGDLKLVLKMEVTAQRTLRVKEDITGELAVVEEELWDQLKAAVSELLRECRQVPVRVELEYSKSQ